MAVYEQPDDPYAGLPPLTVDNIDSITPSDPRFNSVRYIALLNQKHPEYAGAKPGGTATTPGPTTGGWGTPPTDGNWEAWFRTNLGRGTLSSAELKALEPELIKAGVHVLTNAQGVSGKIQLPGGQIVDVIQGAGAGGNTFTWQTGGGASGGGHPIDFSGAGIDPSYLSPWTGHAPTAGDPTFVDPGEFHTPTADDVYKDPSYQFRVDQGRGALENSAAAKGVLNSGGTLSDILNYGQKAASQEYGQIFDRGFGLWNANWNNALTKFRAQKDVSDSSYQRAWNAYTDARDTHFRNQDSAFDKLYKVANLGATAAGV
jgi:hypothetical protein